MPLSLFKKSNIGEQNPKGSDIPPSWMMHKPDIFGPNSCVGRFHSERWCAYFNGWTTWHTHDINRATYPARSKTCLDYAGKNFP